MFLDTNKKLELEASSVNKLTEGLKCILKVVAPAFDSLGKGKDAQTVRAEFEYNHEKAAVTVGVDLLNEKPSAAVSAVVAKDAVQGGVDAVWSLGAAPDLKALAVALGYTAPAGWQATLTRKANDGASGKVTYGLNVYQKIDPVLQLGGEVSFDASAEKVSRRLAACVDSPRACGRQATPTLLVGGQYSVSNGSLKAKLGSGGRLGVAYAQEINYFTKVTVGLDLNVADSKDHKLGLLVDITN